MDCPTVPKKRAPKMARMKVKSSPGFQNKEELMRSKEAGCFHCLATYPPSAIKEWTDKGLTGLCPHCSVDAIIPRNANDSAAAFETRLKRFKTERFDTKYNFMTGELIEPTDLSKEDGTAFVIDSGTGDKGEYVTVKMFGSGRVVTHYATDTDGKFAQLEKLRKH